MGRRAPLPTRLHEPYECDGCGAVWDDAWSATCDDECPRCGHGTSPSHSEEVAPCACDNLGR